MQYFASADENTPEGRVGRPKGPVPGSDATPLQPRGSGRPSCFRSTTCGNIISRRHETRSVVITTNLAYKEWGSMFHDASCPGALIDRFGQHCHVIDIDAESWRNKEAALRRGKSRKPSAEE